MLRPFVNKQLELKIDQKHPSASIELAHAIHPILSKNVQKHISIICIGTDRSTGDSLGPLVGSFLDERTMPSFMSVFGTLADPIHASNLVQKLKLIDEQHPNSFKLAVDACLGKRQNIGSIYFREGPVKPGAGVNKILPPVGDAHITGIVNIAGFMEFHVLQNTRLHLVMELAKTIANGIYKAGLLIELERKKTVNIPKFDYSPHAFYKGK